MKKRPASAPGLLRRELAVVATGRVVARVVHRRLRLQQGTATAAAKNAAAQA